MRKSSGPAVDWAERDNAEDEQVECALREIKLGWNLHAYGFYIYTPYV